MDQTKKVPNKIWLMDILPRLSIQDKKTLRCVSKRMELLVNDTIQFLKIKRADGVNSIDKFPRITCLSLKLPTVDISQKQGLKLFTTLAKYPQLRSLSIKCFSLHQDCGLGKCTQLTSFALRVCISLPDPKHTISALTNLRQLTLCAAEEPKDWTFLGNFPSLVSLTVNMGFGVSLGQICSSAPNLQHLDLSDLSPKELVHLSKFTSLQTARLRGLKLDNPEVMYGYLPQSLKLWQLESHQANTLNKVAILEQFSQQKNIDIRVEGRSLIEQRALLLVKKLGENEFRFVSGQLVLRRRRRPIIRRHPSGIGMDPVTGLIIHMSFRV